MDNWLIWQLVDSAFPAGALAHSGGLEAARQSGFVSDGESLREFVIASIRQTECGPMRFLLAAHGRPDLLDGCEKAWDLQLNNHVANRASRAQGQALVSSASRIFGTVELIALARRVRERQTPGHLATMFGVVTRSLEVPADDAAEMFRFLAVRTIISAAVRLGIVGPLEGQSLQAGLRDAVSESPRAALSAGDQPVAVQTTPILDLLQATQDRLYSRLFQS